MRIAFIQQPISTIRLPARGGSIEVWIYEIARRIAKNHDVIAYSRKDYSQNEVKYDQNVLYKRITINLFDRLFTSIAKYLDEILSKTAFKRIKHPLFSSSLYYRDYAFQVARDLREKRCDVVHIHNYSQFVPIVRALNPVIKIVLHMHCDWLIQLKHSVIEGRLRDVDLIIGCSNYITENIRRNFPEHAGKCRTLHNGADLQQFTRALTNKTNERDIKQLLFVGRISPDKGVHVLIDAFKKIVDYCSEVQMRIVGPKTPLPVALGIALDDDPRISDLQSFYGENYLSHLKKNLPPEIEEKVSFAGFIPREELIKEYQETDIFIFPSIWNEPFGMPIVEAMATGLPVVATRVGGIPEIIEEGKTGILVEPDNEQALAEAIISLLINEDERKLMGAMARERAVKLFSWDTIANNLLQHYEHVFVT